MPKKTIPKVDPRARLRKTILEAAKGLRKARKAASTHTNELRLALFEWAAYHINAALAETRTQAFEKLPPGVGLSYISTLTYAAEGEFMRKWRIPVSANSSMIATYKKSAKYMTQSRLKRGVEALIAGNTEKAADIYDNDPGVLARKTRNRIRAIGDKVSKKEAFFVAQEAIAYLSTYYGTDVFLGVFNSNTEEELAVIE